MINVQRNVRANINRPLIRAVRIIIIKPKSFYFDLVKDIYIVWLLRCELCGLHPVDTSCLPPLYFHLLWLGPAHCELVISPVTASFVLSRLALTVVRGSTCIKEMLSSTSQILQTSRDRREGGEIFSVSPDRERDRVMHQVVVCQC